MRDLAKSDLLRRVRPTPTDAYLGNPHKGCTTAHCFSGDRAGRKDTPSRVFPNAPHPVHARFLPCTVAEWGWYWKALMPEEGVYDFARVEEVFEGAAKYGQTLCLRVAPIGPADKPAPPQWYKDKYAMSEKQWGEPWPYAIPAYDSDDYYEQFGGLVREFGRRYDGHPLLETMDARFIGPWGEGAGEYTDETADRFAQLYAECFPNTPRMALIGGKQLPAGIRAGSGWRCDCFGDLQPSGNSGGWYDSEKAGDSARTTMLPRHLSQQHMYDVYPRRLVLGGALDAWRTQPVFFESCWEPKDWYKRGFDLDFILQQGYKYHGTYFKPKSRSLPEPWLDRLHDWCRRLGYRFVFRQAMYDPRIERGGSFAYRVWIENVGVAPIYHRYPFAFRLRQGKRVWHLPLADVDIREWRPGDAWLEDELALPEDLEPGLVELSAGLLDEQTGQCKVRFAVKERYNDGWVALGDLCCAG